jgi:two-component system, sporulation sensor kinase E
MAKASLCPLWPTMIKWNKLETSDYEKLAPILSGISHELRNPLQGILASISVLRLHLEKEQKLHTFLEIIQRETQRIDDIIGELTELARSKVIDPVPVSVATLIQETVRSLHDTALLRDARIQIKLANHVAPIKIDSEAVRKAITALIQNGIESKPAGAVVSVDLSAEGDQLCISVSDDGEGIPDGDLAGKVMQPFFSTRKGRSGLGLNFADKAARVHGGTVSIESEIGKGTRATIHLPYG